MLPRKTVRASEELEGAARLIENGMSTYKDPYSGNQLFTFVPEEAANEAVRLIRSSANQISTLEARAEKGADESTEWHRKWAGADSASAKARAELASLRAEIRIMGSQLKKCFWFDKDGQHTSIMTLETETVWGIAGRLESLGAEAGLDSGADSHASQDGAPSDQRPK